MVAATGAKLLAHENAKDHIPGRSRARAGDVIKVGRRGAGSLDTPGHTMSHVCVLSHSDTPALFCGDTLFNAGAGNCHNGGHPNELYNTFAKQLAKLPDDDAGLSGPRLHRATISDSPRPRARQCQGPGDAAGNGAAGPQQAAGDDPGTGKEINTFFRLTSPSVIRRLREAFPDLPDNPDQKTVFLKLRELRNKW